MKKSSRQQMDGVFDFISRVHMTRKYRKLARIRNKRMNGGYSNKS